MLSSDIQQIVLGFLDLQSIIKLARTTTKMRAEARQILKPKFDKDIGRSGILDRIRAKEALKIELLKKTQRSWFAPPPKARGIDWREDLRMHRIQDRWSAEEAVLMEKLSNWNFTGNKISEELDLSPSATSSSSDAI